MQNNQFNGTIIVSTPTSTIQIKKEELIRLGLYLIQNWLEKLLTLQGANDPPLSLCKVLFGIIRQTPVSHIALDIELAVRLFLKVLGNAPGRIDGTWASAIAEFLVVLDRW
jgi:hypothetical protein